MPSRREFIRCGLAASALAAYPLSVRLALARSSREKPLRLFKILFDQTSAEGAEFGAEAVSLGGATRAVGGDAGGAWMNEIEPRWKRGPAAIAGLTGRASLFCLELLARDYGMGVVYCAEHSLAASGVVHRVIAGRDQVSQWESRLAAAGNRWGAVAVAMAMSCPKTPTPVPRVDLLDLTQPSSTATPSVFSWVMGPAGQPGILGGRGIQNDPRRG